MPTITIDTTQDLLISSITVSKINEYFYLKFECRSSQIADDLKKTLAALKKNYEDGCLAFGDVGEPQKFVVRRLYNSQDLIVLGNIYNVLHIIKQEKIEKKEVISKATVNILDSNDDIQSIIFESKNFEPRNASIIGFFNSEPSRYSGISFTELDEITEIEDQISSLSDKAKEILFRNLQERNEDFLLRKTTKETKRKISFV
jgi:hypothetical protein